MKKKMSKKPKLGIKFRVSPWLAVLVTALVLQLIALSISASYIGALRASIDQNNDAMFKSLVTSSVHEIYSQAVINPEQERVYIPELRVYFPLNTSTRHLVYTYFPGIDGAQDYALISTRQVAQRRINDFTTIACNRMVRVMFAAGQPGTDEAAPLQKVLLDGRTMYIYKSINECGNVYTDTELDAIVNGVLAAESY